MVASKIKLLFFFCLAAQTLYSQKTKLLDLQYQLTIKLIPNDYKLIVSGEALIPATDTITSELSLIMSDLMKDFKVDVIEPKISNEKVEVIAKKTSNENSEYIIQFENPIPAGKDIRIKFSYWGGQQAAYQFYIGPECSFATAWGTNWYPLVKRTNDKGIGTLHFSVPVGHKVYATGIRKSSPQEEEQGLFTFEVKNKSYFGFASGKYIQVSKAGTVPVTAYILQERKNIDEYLKGLSNTIQILQQEFGPYPFNELALVEVPSEIANKAKFSGAALEGFFLANSRIFIAPEFKLTIPYIAHELGHQWFPFKVSLTGKKGRFTEEALAQYGSLRVVEKVQGEDFAKQYRQTGLPNYTTEFSAEGYFKIAEAGKDQRLDSLFGENGRRLAYTKGFIVFDMLSREIGRKQFQKIMYTITNKYAFREITWNEFVTTIKRKTGNKLSWFFEQWFERMGAPTFEIKELKQNRKYVQGIIEQSAPFYTSHIELELKGEKKSIIKTLFINNRSMRFKVRTNFKVETVNIDPDYKVLRTFNKIVLPNE